MKLGYYVSWIGIVYYSLLQKGKYRLQSKPHHFICCFGQFEYNTQTFSLGLLEIRKRVKMEKINGRLVMPVCGIGALMRYNRILDGMICINFLQILSFKNGSTFSNIISWWLLSICIINSSSMIGSSCYHWLR